MKVKGFGSDSYVTRSLRRAHRVLAAAGLLALTVVLWPSPAQAKVTCKVVDLRVCGRLICCLQTCVYCEDASGNLVGEPACSEPICYYRYP